MAKEVAMAMVKRIGWVVLGVLIGALSSSALVATKQLPEPPTPRLAAFGRSSIGNRTATLIKDTKSDACWLLISASAADGGMALAPAPNYACSQQ